MKVLYLALGGVLGTLARFYLSHFAQRPFHHHIRGFPIGTLFVNLLGCYAAGVIVGVADKWGWGAGPRVFLLAGFCGAFTTFSAFMVETAGLFKGPGAGLAFLNVGLSLVLGYLCLAAGAFTARSL